VAVAAESDERHARPRGRGFWRAHAWGASAKTTVKTPMAPPITATSRRLPATLPSIRRPCRARGFRGQKDVFAEVSPMPVWSRRRFLATAAGYATLTVRAASESRPVVRPRVTARASRRPWGLAWPPVQAEGR